MFKYTIHNFWQAARIVDNNSRDQKLAVLMKCYKDGNDSEKTRFSYWHMHAEHFTKSGFPGLARKYPFHLWIMKIGAPNDLVFDLFDLLLLK